MTQISYVGYEHVDHDTVSDAIAGQTLFIHGSRVDDGSGASIKATAAAAAAAAKGDSSNKNEEDKTSAGKDQATTTTATKRRRRRRLSADQKSQRKKMRSSECPSACESKETRKALPRGTSTVCDATCGGGGNGVDARFDGFLCGAGDSEKFGGLCRLCYTRIDEAREAQRALLSSNGGAAAGVSVGDNRDVIMCDTMQPPAADVAAAEEEEAAAAAVVNTDAAACSDKCIEKEDTVSHHRQTKMSLTPH